MRLPAFTAARPSVIQRKCACFGVSGRGGKGEQGRKNQFQRKALDPEAKAQISMVPSIVDEDLRSPGQPLDTETRGFMEPRFRHDFSQVRVHRDAKAAESSRRVNALAYTVGRNVVFGEGQYDVHGGAGQRLLAHELTHVIQQSSARNRPQPRNGELAIAHQQSDAFEQEADAAAGRVLGGMPPGIPRATRELAVQRQSPGGDTSTKPPDKQGAGDVVLEGLKTVVEQAKDDNPQVKKTIIDPLKLQLKTEWGHLGAGDKGAVIGLGATTLGLASGAMLSDPAGRKQLAGVNLAAPFTLIPYVPLSTFKYTLPSGNAPDKGLFTFETGFKADDLINLRTESRGLPKMSLGVNLRWAYDPETERLNVTGGDATLGLVPGLTLSAGAYKDVLRPPEPLLGPEGQTTQIKKSVPEFTKPQPIPDVRIMLQVDLMKFKPGDLVRQVEGFFQLR